MRCRRIVWLNPMMAWQGYSPEAQGIRAALPHVDLYAPANTPRGIINKLNREMVAALNLPDVQKTMRNLGAEPAPTTPAELDKFVVQDLATVAKLARAAGIQPE